MTPRTRHFALPPVLTPRPGRAGGGHGTAARGRAARVRHVGSRAALAVAGLAFVGGVGAGAVVRPAGDGPAEAAATSAGEQAAGAGTAAARSAARGDVPAAGEAVRTRAAGDAVDGAARADGGARAGGGAATDAAVSGVTGAADPGEAPVDLRPIPQPQLVDRDTVGPLWLTPADRAAGVLALDVPEAASGVLDVVPGGSAAPGAVGVRTVRVEVERGLPVDGATFAATVMAALNDPRGWGARGDVSFARTDGAADLRVVLASPALTDALCAPLDTGGEVSCGRNGHAALNFRRWVLATEEFADRTQYRQYLVNHEVGHLLGHAHQRCPGPGQPAPLMQQQSLRVAPCLPNGWPYP